MRTRALAAFVLVACSAFACVDLFHSTDFDTLCTKSPPDPSCSDGAVADAAADAVPPPAIDFCTLDGARAQALAEHACAWLGACEGPIDSSRFGTCVAHARLMMDCAANPSRRPHGATETLYQCLASADSCAKVDACVFPKGLRPCPTFDAGSFTACSDDTRVECVANQQRPASIEPCAAFGQTCFAINGSTSICAGTHSASCPGSAVTCSGSAVVSCSKQPGLSAVDVGYDCASFGEGTCASTDAGAGCTASSAPACSDPLDVHCSTSGIGEVAVSCVQGHQIAVDCNAVSARCSVVDGGVPGNPETACGQPASNAPTCTGDDTCAGNVLTSCAGAVKHTLDCTSVGLGPCSVKSGYARCTAP